jgi:hypothetical protein
MDGYDVFDARLMMADFGDRRVEELDISGLSGNYYIRVHAVDAAADPGFAVDVFAYKVWLE